MEQSLLDMIGHELIQLWLPTQDLHRNVHQQHFMMEGGRGHDTPSSLGDH